MFRGIDFRSVGLFVSLYLLFSLPPFLIFNLDVVRTVYAQRFPPDLPLLVGLLVVVATLIAGILLADRGIDRYTDFVIGPTDPLSILLGSSFLWAAISWWFLPELVFVAGLPVSLNILLVFILVSQLPMLFFLSFLTAIGTVQDGDIPQ